MGGLTKETLLIASGSAEAKAVLVFWPGLLTLALLRFLPSWLLPSFLHFSGATLLLLLGVICAVAKHFSAGGKNTAVRDLRGRTALVTGGATGIGMETVRELAKMGANVVLTARGGEQRLSEALAKARTGLPPAIANRISSASLDLSSFKSIRAFVAEFGKQHSKLHLLLNNAGVMMSPYGLTEDGLETQIGTNHFGHFLLTSLLLPTLLATAAKESDKEAVRIVNLASLAHSMTPEMTYPQQNDKKTYDATVAYADSKLANIYFTTELEKRYGARHVHSYAVHPGVVNTELSRHLPSLTMLVARVPNFFCNKTPLQGAQTTLHCALSAQAKPGRYHADARTWPVSRAAKDEKKAAWLWEESEKVCDVKPPA